MKEIRVTTPLYGGSFRTTDPSLSLPFVLPEELVEVAAGGQILRIIEAATGRVEPRCPHFSVCGGCQYQMAGNEQQLDIKRSVLKAELQTAGIVVPLDIPAHAAEPYGYRNRIRLRVGHIDGELRVGYNVRTTTEFLPIVTCPIAAPILWETAEALLATAALDRDAAFWLDAATEIELFCDHDLARVQVTLLCAPRTKVQQGSLIRVLSAVKERMAQVVGIAAIASDPRTGPTGRTLDAAGAAGLNYRVGDETYWITRGGFFQVNRFLLETLVGLVCDGRNGSVAWDLFAGVGLFSRVLARSYAQVTAVEANPIAANDLRGSFAKIGPNHTAVQATTLDFLRSAVLQRERPDLIVLDPPRAGAGVEACALLARLAPRLIVYISCDPTTLARDLAVLLAARYRIDAMHLVDLFPQTFHLETVVVLERES